MLKAQEAKEVSPTPSQLKTAEFVKAVNGAIQSCFAVSLLAMEMKSKLTTLRNEEGIMFYEKMT